jgi:hypothetical protein
MGEMAGQFIAAYPEAKPLHQNHLSKAEKKPELMA